MLAFDKDWLMSGARHLPSLRQSLDAPPSGRMVVAASRPAAVAAAAELTYAEYSLDMLSACEHAQGLRRLVRAGEVSSDRAADAIADLADLDLHRHPHLDLLTRAWKLRENVTAYDAMYVALAEALDAPIVTCDTPLADTPGHRARIEALE